MKKEWGRGIAVPDTRFLAALVDNDYLYHTIVSYLGIAVFPDCLR